MWNRPNNSPESKMATVGLYFCNKTFVTAPLNSNSSNTGPSTATHKMPSQPDCNTSKVCSIQSGRNVRYETATSVRNMADTPANRHHNRHGTPVKAYRYPSSDKYLAFHKKSVIYTMPNNRAGANERLCAKATSRPPVVTYTYKMDNGPAECFYRITFHEA